MPRRRTPPAPPRRHPPRRTRAGGRSGAAALGAVLLVAAPVASAQPVTRTADPPTADQELPFVCAEEWTGSTRPSHSPSPLSVDWNRADDVGRPALASAAGVVTRVEHLGRRSYGTYVVVDHGGGESTLYAHLQAEYVAVGQRLDQGEMLGRVGGSGAVSGAHLHYEQRHDGRVRQPWFHDEAFPMGSTVASRNCVDVPVAGDWDGDEHADVAVYRRAAAGVFRLSTGPVSRVRFGAPVDDPLVGDWNGDGTPDVGVRRGGSTTFALRVTGGATTTTSFGAVGDRGLAGDWDGDGRTDVGVWRPATATFLLRAGDGSVRSVRLGAPEDLPVTGDWDGDGRTDVGVFAEGEWTLWSGAADGVPRTRDVSLGGPGDLPTTGDWDGDGVTDPAVWSPQTATFTLSGSAGLDGTPRQEGGLRTVRFGRPR